MGGWFVGGGVDANTSNTHTKNTILYLDYLAKIVERQINCSVTGDGVWCLAIAATTTKCTLRFNNATVFVAQISMRLPSERFSGSEIHTLD